MSAIKTLTRIWLQHVETCSACDSRWTGRGGEECQRGRGIQAQLEHALDRDMPPEEDPAIPFES